MARLIFNTNPQEVHVSMKISNPIESVFAAAKLGRKSSHSVPRLNCSFNCSSMLNATDEG